METKHFIVGMFLIVGIYLTSGCAAVAPEPPAPAQVSQPQGCAPGGACLDGKPEPPAWTTGLTSMPYHEHALYNFQLGRGYMAQGRYELARERYLLALAVARDDAMRMRLSEELDAVDRLILSQR
ncbi:MAG: hypothetical protein AB7E47_15155 [Desulfovibrionaceae bacterium]